MHGPLAHPLRLLGCPYLVGVAPPCLEAHISTHDQMLLSFMQFSELGVLLLRTSSLGGPGLGPGTRCGP